MLNIKKLLDIMREDGVSVDTDRMKQIVWILFLKIYDSYIKLWRDEAEFEEREYTPIIPEKYAWDKWASYYTIENNQKVLKKDLLTGDELLNFVNNELFKDLKNLELPSNATTRDKIVKVLFESTSNFMKNGINLRKVINEIDELDFSKEQKQLPEVYEHFLLILKSAGNAGEYYTPRAVTDFIMECIKPEIGDQIADLACGTGGFLTSAYRYLRPQVTSGAALATLKSSLHGIEKNDFPYILCVTNFLINLIENIDIQKDNALKHDLSYFDDQPHFEVIVMNPPYGSKENKNERGDFGECTSSETADLFTALIIERLSRPNIDGKGGKAAVVLPDGFLFGDDSAKLAIKKRLLNKCNLHTILRLPKSVFAPYTSITTNILFFDKDPNGTTHTSFYRLDMPDGLKAFSKTKFIEKEHFNPFWEWIAQGKQDLEEPNGFKAKTYTKAELQSRNYNLDLCGFIEEEEEILDPLELMQSLKAERKRLNHTLDSIMDQISQIIKDNQGENQGEKQE